MFHYGLTLVAFLNPWLAVVCLLLYLRRPEWDPTNVKGTAVTPSHMYVFSPYCKTAELPGFTDETIYF